MDNIQSNLYDDDDDELSDDYLWLRWENSCKQIRYKRFLLNSMAIKYNINPDNYKNKRLLVNAILDYWNNIFRDNPEFKHDYEEHFGCCIKF